MDVGEDREAHGASVRPTARPFDPPDDRMRHTPAARARVGSRVPSDGPAPTALVIATLQPRLAALVAAVEAAGWRAQAHADPGRALDALRDGAPGLLVIDAYLRGASAAGFTAWSRRLDPTRPVVLVRAGDDVPEDARAARGRARADAVVDFPPDPSRLPGPPSTAAHPPTHPAPDGGGLPLEGTTEVVPLPDLVEMAALGGGAASIVLHGPTRGRLWVEGGALVHAEAHHGGTELTGVRALAALLAVVGAPFEVRTGQAASRRTVHVPTAAALTEAARLVDEAARAGEVLRRVAAEVPDVLGAAVGYPLNEAPTTVHGDGAHAFTVAKELLELARGRVGVASHLAVEGERHAFAALRFGEGNVIAAHAPRGRSLVLLAALTKAVRSGSR